MIDEKLYDEFHKYVKNVIDNEITLDERLEKIKITQDIINLQIKPREEKLKLANTILAIEGIFVSAELILGIANKNIAEQFMNITNLGTAILIGQSAYIRKNSKEELEYLKKQKKYFEDLKKLYIIREKEEQEYYKNNPKGGKVLKYKR